MNPYTQSLLLKINDPAVHAFVLYWDSLTELVIQVFKQKTARPEDELAYREVRAWLRKQYPSWGAELEPYWQMTQVGGRFAEQDPFAFLLSFEKAQHFIERWDALQHLPAAREALNQYLTSLAQASC